jgi:hypothetical protein
MKTVSRQRIRKDVPAATDTKTTIELLLETAFSTREWSTETSHEATGVCCAMKSCRNVGPNSSEMWVRRRLLAPGRSLLLGNRRSVAIRLPCGAATRTIPIRSAHSLPGWTENQFILNLVTMWCQILKNIAPKFHVLILREVFSF